MVRTNKRGGDDRPPTAESMREIRNKEKKKNKEDKGGKSKKGGKGKKKEDKDKGIFTKLGIDGVLKFGKTNNDVPTKTDIKEQALEVAESLGLNAELRVLFADFNKNKFDLTQLVGGLKGGEDTTSDDRANVMVDKLMTGEMEPGTEAIESKLRCVQDLAYIFASKLHHAESLGAAKATLMKLQAAGIHPTPFLFRDKMSGDKYFDIMEMSVLNDARAMESRRDKANIGIEEMYKEMLNDDIAGTTAEVSVATSANTTVSAFAAAFASPVREFEQLNIESEV